MAARPIRHQRGLAAAQTLLTAWEELRGDMSRSDPLASMLCASKVLQADDDRGTGAGLVVQGEDVYWESLDTLLELAVYGMLTHRSLAHDDERQDGCRLCVQSEATWHNDLIGRLLRGRSDT
jgi:hypothetical protein